MSVAYMQRVIEDARLVLLRLLAESPGYSANSSILDAALEDFGHRMSRDQVDTQLHWLAEQGLLTIEHVKSVVIATLTPRGLDVARGEALAPGVKKPGPGS